MANFSDIMHDLGGFYAKLQMGCADSKEDLGLLIKNGPIKFSEFRFTETVTYVESVLARVKHYMSSAGGYIDLVRPLIDEIAGKNNEIYSIKKPNDQIRALVAKTLDILSKDNLKKLSESDLLEALKTTEENLQEIRDVSKQAEGIFLSAKEELYEKIGRTTEVDFGNGYRVLLLDDEADICEYLSNFLNKKRFNVQTALEPGKAMELTKSFKPQIALLDYKLDSEETGMDVLKFIRINRPECKCIMFTFVDDKDLLQKCKDLGAVGTLVKPVAVDVMKRELYKAVKEILNGT